jgi:peptidoglycan/LPS O-acetylase OafA/YrhL
MSANLDLLRASAVLLVLVAHLQAFFNGPNNSGFWGHIGRWGVLLFFVHTCFVLMQSLARTRLEGRALVMHFYVRRAFRLYPLALVAVFAAITLEIPQKSFGDYHWIGWGGVASNALLVTNLTFTQELIGPMWSLPFELQMYAVLPLLYWVTTSARPLTWTLALWVGAVFLASVITPDLVHRAKILQFVPCFMAGVIGYTLAKTQRPVLPAWAWPIAMTVAWALFAFLPGRNGWIPCLVLGLSIPFFRDLRQPAVTWSAKQVATYSYGIYLFHMPLIWLSFRVLGELPFMAQCGVFVAGLVGVPFGLYHTIERPMIGLGGRVSEYMTTRRVPRPVLSPKLSVVE